MPAMECTLLRRLSGMQPPLLYSVTTWWPNQRKARDVLAWCRSDESELEGYFQYRLEMYAGNPNPYDMSSWWQPPDRRYRLQIWFSEESSIAAFWRAWPPDR